jgi:hypothetical protein
MTKKPKKVKTPKAPKGRGGNGGGKDPVTGLSIEYGGPSGTYLVQSDKVINTQDLSRAILGRETDILGGGIAEFEISRDYLVMTSSILNESGKTLWRQISTGKFEFDKKGVLRGGRLDVITELYHELDDSGNTTYQSGSATTFPDGQAIAKIMDVTGRNISPSRAVKSNNFYLNVQNNFFAEGSASDRDKVMNFANGRFFQEGWWQDPFTTNLI